MKGYFLGYKRRIPQLFLATFFCLVSLANAEAQCPTSDVTINITDVTCNGFNDGTFEIILNDPNGYTGNYSFALIGLPSNGGDLVNRVQAGSDPSTVFTGLPPGSYTWFVTFGPGCPGFSAGGYTILQPPALNASVSGITPACTPGTGSVSLDVSGGNGGYSFSWTGPTDPGNVEDAVNLDAGTYNVTVTDLQGCNITLTNIFVPVVTQADAGADQVVCSNTAVLEGNAFNPSGETGSWTLVSGSGNITDATDPNSQVTNLGVGDNVFEWFITDSGGICAGTTDQVVISWYNLELSDPADILLACNGAGDGSGSFTATGGSAPFVFTVDNNTTGAATSSTATSLDFTGAGPGTITVSVTDANGCVQQQSVDITEPPVIALDSETSTDVTCDGGADGSVSVLASGGTGALSYTLMPGAITNGTGTFNGLAAGDYTVEVTDANLCGPVVSSTLTIASPPAITIDNTNTTDVTCNGGTDGQIEITATGGTGVLTYTLQPAAVSNTTGIFAGLAAGSYTVEVTDENGCGPVVSGTIDITEPAGVTIDNVAFTDVTCSGASDGTITVTASGGVTPYDFTLQPANITNNTGSFTGLAAGTYTVEVAEANGCGPVISSPVTISDATLIVVTAPVTTDATCTGADDGTLSVTASGGTGVYTYTIQPLGLSNSTGVFNSLAPGTYTVDVEDSNGCTVTSADGTIAEPAGVVIDNTAITDATCPGGTDGQITVTASGGTAPLTYTLQPGAVVNSTGIFAGLAPGTYSVDISDANGCGPVSATDLIVGQPVPDQPVDDVTVCNPVNSDIILTLNSTQNGTTFELQDLSGNPLSPPVQASGPAGPVNLVIDQANAPVVTTTYQVAVTLPSCPEYILPDQFVVTVTDAPSDVLAVSDVVLCEGESSDASFVIAGSENGVTYELQQTDGSSLSPAVTAVGNGGDLNLTILAADLPAATTTYQVAASAAGGCSSVLTDQPVLTFQPLPDATLAGDATICPGESATLAVTLTGTGPWNLTYSDGVTETTVVANSPNYDLVVSPAATTTYSLVRVEDAGTACLRDPLSSSATVTVSPVAGDQVTYGAGAWIGYVYDDSNDPRPYPGRVDFDTDKYRGFINQPFNFDLNIDAGAVSGPDLCTDYSDNYSIRFRMNADFVPGTYEITVGGDDGFRLSLDGGATFVVDEWRDQSYLTETIQLCLDGNYDLVLEYYENGGVSRVSFNSTLLSPAETMDVAIAADQLPVCSGDAATFRATVTNGGAVPSFQWQVNGVDVPGETSDVFTSTLLNDGDVIRVVAEADPSLTCVLNDPATSNELTFSSTSDLTATVSITADQNPACVGTDITFTAAPADAGPNPTYQWQVNGADAAGETGDTFVASGLNDGDVVRVVLTPDPAVTCITNSTANSNEITASFVSDLTATASIVADQNPVCAGTDVTFTSAVTDAGSNPSYQWQVNGADVAGETTDTFVTSSLTDGDIVRLIVTADPLATCVSNSPVTSNEVIISIQPSTSMSVSVAADQNPVCQGDAVNFTATVTDGGASPTYQWQINGTDIAGETGATFTSATLNNNDVVTVTVTADPALTCVVNSPLLSNGILMNISDSLEPVVSIVADQNPACTGATINFTATASDAGANPSYQWQVNGSDVAGETGSTFAAAGLADGDQVQVVLTADPSVTCILSPVVVSNTINMSLVDSLTPQVTVTADQDPSCISDAVTFTASFTESGATPSFQWQVNGADVAGETGQNFTSASLNDGDLVTVVLTADPLATCVTTTQAISAPFTVNRVGSLSPTVFVNASQTTICTGTDVLFTASVINAGPNPGYQWQVNGVDVAGETNDSFLTNALADGDLVRLIVSVDPSVSCSTVTEVTSPETVISVDTEIIPAVTITADQTAICTGNTVTFTANAVDAGLNPSYQWQINGVDVAGETSETFVSSALSDGDQVQLVLTADPSLTCANPSVVSSNVIDISVVTSLNPAVTILADQNPVCVGDAVTWTATVTEAGADPTYQWLVNGAAIAGETNPVFTSSSLNNGDLVSVEVTVDPAATCAATPVVSSSQEVQNVVTSLTPTAAIVASQTTICSGNQVIFTANASNAGPVPTYQWQINGAPVAGANSDTFITTALADGDQVNVIVGVDPAVSCATTTSVTSNNIAIAVRPAGDPACVGGGENCGAFVITVTPTRPPCTAPDSGELSFLISGGTGNYTVVLSDMDGFSQGEAGLAGTPIIFEDLTASDYMYTITDGNGTTCTLPFTLDNETILEAAILSTTDAACFDQPDGSVTVEVLSGGNAPYEYSLDGILWRQVTTSVFTVDGLSPQDSPIGILIRDNASDQCPEEVMVDINNLYPQINADITASPVLTCDGDEGEITVAFPPTGGNSPNGVWNIAIAEGVNAPGGFDPFGADRTFTGLAAGEYTIFLEDEGGCVREIPVIVEAPNQVQLLADVNAADCSLDGKSGELNLQVTNSSQVPGPYDLVITGLTGANAGDIIFANAAWSGGFISIDTLVSGNYEIMVTPSDPDLCVLTVEREITGGPQPVSFDYALQCAPASASKELLLTDIQGNDGELYTLRVYDNLTSALVEEISFTINIGNQYLISNYPFLTQTREYRLRLVQSPAVCAGSEVRYDHPDNLVIPQQLLAEIGETTKSLPDRPTGTLEVVNFTGGYQPDDNSFPYLTYIELDSAAIPGQSFSAGFDTVRLDQNLDYAILYEKIPAGRYTILVSDQIGCTFSLTGRVPLDTDIFIPNIFTPNNDGSNETFYIRNKPDTEVKLIITNRWGKQVYSSNNYQNNWDGGEEPDGVYYYMIDTGEDSYKGWVEIMRGSRP